MKRIHMVSNIIRENDTECLAEWIADEAGIEMCEHQIAQIAAFLRELFDAMDRKTDFSWDDLPKVIDELAHEPDPQLMLPFITPQDVKKWERLRKKFRKGARNESDDKYHKGDLPDSELIPMGIMGDQEPEETPMGPSNETGKTLFELRHEIEVLGLAVGLVTDNQTYIHKHPRAGFLYAADHDGSTYLENHLTLEDLLANPIPGYQDFLAFADSPVWFVLPDEWQAIIQTSAPPTQAEIDQAQNTYSEQNTYSDEHLELCFIPHPDVEPFQEIYHGGTWEPCLIIEGPDTGGYSKNGRVVCDAPGALKLLEFLELHKYDLKRLAGENDGVELLDDNPFDDHPF